MAANTSSPNAFERQNNWIEPSRIAQLHEDDLTLVALGHHATSHLYTVFSVLAIFKISIFLIKIDDVM